MATSLHYVASSSSSPPAPLPLPPQPPNSHPTPTPTTTPTQLHPRLTYSGGSSTIFDTKEYNGFGGVNSGPLISRLHMMTSSNGNIFRVTGPLCGEFTGHRWILHTKRPVTLSFDVLFDPRLNKSLSKQSWGWWYIIDVRHHRAHYDVIVMHNEYPGHMVAVEHGHEYKKTHEHQFDRSNAFKKTQTILPIHERCVYHSEVKF